MTFWDTVRGHELANTLIRYLPTLVAAKQKAITLDENDYPIADKINELIQDGYHIDNIIKTDDTKYIFIISK